MLLRKILLLFTSILQFSESKTVTKTVHYTRTISCHLTPIIDVGIVDTSMIVPTQTEEIPTSTEIVPTQNSIPTNDIELTNLINQHRTSLGLSKIPISTDAWLVASTHNYDLQNGNSGWSGRGQTGCSAHSWSNNPGKWSGCCYVIQNPNGPCMWNKPYEITGNRLRGYEIGSSGQQNMLPRNALNMWLNSPSHRAVIENTGMWYNIRWAGVGCSLNYNQQGCWFLA